MAPEAGGHPAGRVDLAAGRLLGREHSRGRGAPHPRRDDDDGALPEVPLHAGAGRRVCIGSGAHRRRPPELRRSGGAHRGAALGARRGPARLTAYPFARCTSRSGGSTPVCHFRRRSIPTTPATTFTPRSTRVSTRPV